MSICTDFLSHKQSPENPLRAEIKLPLGFSSSETGVWLPGFQSKLYSHRYNQKPNMTYDTVPSSIQDQVLQFPARIAPATPRSSGVQIASLGRLRLSAKQRLAFRFDWLREEAAGRIAGDFGLTIRTPLDASIEIAIQGEFAVLLSLDADQWLRLRVVARGSEAPAARVNVNVPVPEQPEELAAAILGVHHSMWLKDLARLARAGVSCDIPSSIAPAALMEWFGVWEQLDARAQDALWRGGSAKEPPQELVCSLPDSCAWMATLAALKQHAAERLAIENAISGLQDARAFASLDNWLRVRLYEAFGSLETPADFDRGRRTLDELMPFVRSAYASAASAAEARWEAELAAMCSQLSAEPPLIDCSFAFTPQGLDAYRKAVTGGFSGLHEAAAEHVRVNESRLTSGPAIDRLSTVELRMPFLDRKQWNDRWERLPHRRTSGAEDGSLKVLEDSDEPAGGEFATSLMLALGGPLLEPGSPSIALNAHDRHQVDLPRANAMLDPILKAYGFSEDVPRWIASAAGANPQGRLDISLALSLGGSCAAEWLAAPRERDPEFFDVHSEVSVAIQRALRLWLPYAYFSDIKRYEDAHAGYALLFYSALRPFPGRPRSEFTYEVFAPDSPEFAKRTTLRNFTLELQRMEAALNLAGKPKVARCYAPRYMQDILPIVRRQPRLLNSLLMNDAFFVDSFVRLGTTAREVSDGLASDRQNALKALAKVCRDLAVSFDRKLRRLYSGQSLPGLGAVLLVEATRALVAARNPEVSVGAALRLQVGEEGSAPQLFVNSRRLTQ